MRKTLAIVVSVLVVIGLGVVVANRGAGRHDAAAVRPQAPPSVEEPSSEATDEDQGGADDHTADGETREAADTAKARTAAFRAAGDAGLLGLTRPIRSVPNAGWTTEHVWNARKDDWEPAIATDPTAPYVYALSTRYSLPRRCATCRIPAIVLRVSGDGGKTWRPDRFLCACPNFTGGQYDPVIEVDGRGTVHAVWLQGFDPGAVYSRSTDHGKTWTDPVAMPFAWSDKPQLAVSTDGRDVYVDVNGPSQGDSQVGVSHDGGVTFTRVKVTDSDRYYFAGGAWTSADGRHVVFAQSGYRQGGEGRIRFDAALSDDGGSSWRSVRVATGFRQPPCTSKGCYDGFYGPTPALAGDPDGDLLYLYAANRKPGAPQRVYVTTSSDGGSTWTQTTALSPPGANAIFPAAASGGPGDFRVWWMDTRTGRWNVWYARTTDGGATWSTPIRLSNATSGTPYKSRRGFLEAYGDYGEMGVTSGGKTVAIWGEGASYAGPGGVWFVRQR